MLQMILMLQASSILINPELAPCNVVTCFYRPYVVSTIIQLPQTSRIGYIYAVNEHKEDESKMYTIDGG